jgi:hypothetical protein
MVVKRLPVWRKYFLGHPGGDLCREGAPKAPHVHDNGQTYGVRHANGFDSPDGL